MSTDPHLKAIPETFSDPEARQHAVDVSEALTSLVNASDPTPGRFGESNAAVLAKTDELEQHHVQLRSFLSKFIPPLQKLAAHEHLGNYVALRGPDAQQQWESMPIYVRLGMHFLFCNAHTAVSTSYVENELKRQSINQGKLFDSEEGAQEHIAAFIRTYALESTLEELAEPDPTKYKTFNDFFSRKLKVGARPVTAPDDWKVVTSAADCRLTVFDSLDNATKFWVKSREFTLPNLFKDDALSSLPEFSSGCCLAIFRLAPQDFHRWVSPVDCTLAVINKLPGELFTVNPQAVNEDFPVFTKNRRDVAKLMVNTPSGQVPVVMVAVGAMLVGSINWTVPQGESVKKGDEMGYFAYGGSTVICAFPKDSVAWSADILENSAKSLETLVQCGEQIASFVSSREDF